MTFAKEMKILSYVSLILVSCSFVLSGAETEKEEEDRSIPPIFKAVLNGAASEVLQYSKEGGDFSVRWKSYDDSPLIIHAPDLTMTSLLIHLGADPQVKSKSDFSALMSAGRNGDLAQARFLVKGGLSIHAADTHGRHVIHFAIGNLNPRYLRWILEEGANVNSKTIEGVTPLMEAMLYPNYDEIKILLLHGADPRIKDAEGKDSLDYLKARKDYQAEAVYKLAYNLIQEANKSEQATPRKPSD